MAKSDIAKKLRSNGLNLADYVIYLLSKGATDSWDFCHNPKYKENKISFFVVKVPE